MKNYAPETDEPEVLIFDPFLWPLKSSKPRWDEEAVIMGL